MPEPNAIFEGNSVIEYSDEQEFKKIPDAFLLDFLPRIYKWELGVLDRWKQYFNGIGTPFAITATTDSYKETNGRMRVVDRFTLWKERRV